MCIAPDFQGKLYALGNSSMNRDGSVEAEDFVVMPESFAEEEFAIMVNCVHDGDFLWNLFPQQRISLHLFVDVTTMETDLRERAFRNDPEKLFRQFNIDFPRTTVIVDGHRTINPKVVMAKMQHLNFSEFLVTGLLTQSSMALPMEWLCRQFYKPPIIICEPAIKNTNRHTVKIETNGNKVHLVTIEKSLTGCTVNDESEIHLDFEFFIKMTWDLSQYITFEISILNVASKQNAQ